MQSLLWGGERGVKVASRVHFDQLLESPTEEIDLLATGRGPVGGRSGLSPWLGWKRGGTRKKETNNN